MELLFTKVIQKEIEKKIQLSVIVTLLDQLHNTYKKYINVSQVVQCNKESFDSRPSYYKINLVVRFMLT